MQLDIDFCPYLDPGPNHGFQIFCTKRNFLVYLRANFKEVSNLHIHRTCMPYAFVLILCLPLKTWKILLVCLAAKR